MAKILIIEDDTKTANAIRSGLRGEGYDAAVARTGEDGFFQLSAEPFDLVVLDWMLPGRESPPETPWKTAWLVWTAERMTI